MMLYDICILQLHVLICQCTTQTIITHISDALHMFDCFYIVLLVRIHFFFVKGGCNSINTYILAIQPTCGNQNEAALL